jgi:hypothetical protein
MNEELKELIKAKLTVDQFFDLLNMDFDDIVEDYSEEIYANRLLLTDACRD